MSGQAVRKTYDVSVLVVSYRPDYEKLIMTVKSCLLQKDVSVQIVAADDGSDIDYFAELEDFFSKAGFQDYLLVKNLENNGTVKNFLSGLRKCEGDYVKAISPGDYMCSDTALRRWIDYMKRENIKMSGASYYCYYSDAAGKVTATRQKLHPHIGSLSGRKLRANYLLNDDIFLGAATLCERELLFKYVSMLDGKVKYAEDNCFRIMAYCGEPMGYFDEKMVLYEFGTGISTNKDNRWPVLLHEDWAAADDMMLNMEIEDKRMMKDFKLLIAAKSAGGRKYLQYFRIRGLVLYKLRTKIRPRLSADNLPDDWIRRLGGDCT